VKPVVIAATMGFERGNWFLVREGIRGLLVRDERAVRINSVAFLWNIGNRRRHGAALRYFFRGGCLTGGRVNRRGENVLGTIIRAPGH